MIVSFRGDYEFLSNFYHSQVERAGIVYPTVEHAFQAAKTLDFDEQERVRQATSPAQAKRIGRKVTLRADWERVKLSIMEELLRRKFRDPDLAQRLVATGSAELIEGNNWNDRFWGVCRGTGQNHLGRILMRIREELVERTLVVGMPQPRFQADWPVCG